MPKPLLAAAALCAITLAALAIHPAFDLDVAALFYVPPAHFIGDTPLGEVARYTFWIAPFALLAVMILAGVARHFGVIPQKFGPNRRALLFIILSFAISPGLLVYAALKPLAHRPRPYSVTQFGGPERFRPFTRFDGTCMHSCSFPSGETAGAAWTLAPASLVPPPWRGLAIGAALAFTGATGLLRIAFGGHFLSDVLGAAFLTLLAILLARRIVKP